MNNSPTAEFRIKNRLLILAIIILLPVLNSLSLSAEDKNDPESGIDSSRDLIILPVAFYSPETSVAFGVGGAYSFRISGLSKESRPSSIGLFSIYTLKKQFQISLSPDIYTMKDKYHIFGALNFNKFVDKFYGIGSGTTEEMEETYSSRFVQISGDVHRKMFSRLYMGFHYEYFHHKLTEFEENGLLAGEKIPGSEPGAASGLGLVTKWDSRDNIYKPSKGSFHQVGVTFFRKSVGSDFNFTRTKLDLRSYVSFLGRHVIAVQTYLSLIDGTAPFYLLSLMGGPYLMRGYWLGRYRDKNMTVVQMDYRMPVFKRAGLVAFLGFGDVAEKLGQFSFDKFKTSFGIGIRYVLNPEEGLSFRMDVGFGEDSTGVYFTVNEAF